MKKISFLIMATIALLFFACKKKATENVVNNPVVKGNDDPAGAPPKQWTEHWFEHVQVLNRVFYNGSVVVYYDDAVSRAITWPNTYMAEAWEYTKKTYGQFGTDPKLYVIYHTGKYGGGHPSTYMDAGHDYRNVTDCGKNEYNAWLTGVGNDIDLSTHEIGHIVEGASKGVHGSPAFDIWHDSKWMEIYQYDVYLGLNRTDDATRWFNMMNAGNDSYPRPNTHWFKDWFYPIYNGYGKSAVLNKFFALLAEHFPKTTFNNGVTTYPEYSRKMNFGEFVHFWSGAAGTDLKTLALNAFGDKDEKGNDWTVQLTTAKVTFSGITY